MPGLLRGMARTAVVAGTATHVANNVSRRQQRKWASQDQASAQDQGADQEQDQAAPVDDTTAQLEQLADLKNKGILTEEEFTAKKKQILGI